MKRVLLMRHAKSSWDNHLHSDHERPLNERGKLDAPNMAKYIVEKGFLPELMLVSDSVRTRETRELIMPFLPAIPTQFSPPLYMASVHTIIDHIKNTDNLLDTVLVLAHNPGITEAFYELAHVRIDNVPTAGVGCITFDVDSFKNIAPHNARLEYFIYPKMY
jgi:phosphohistidine phosphatase